MLGGVGEDEGDSTEGEVLPPLDALTSGLLGPPPLVFGDITFDLLDDRGDDGEDTAVAPVGLVAAAGVAVETVAVAVAAAATATAAAADSVPFSSVSSSSELNHISSSSSSWRGSRRNRVVRSKDGTL